MRRLHHWLLSVLVCTSFVPVGCVATGRRPAETERKDVATARRHEPIRVGAWNIEWLGTPQRRSGPAKGQARTPKALAEYILAADVDVLGLEEIKIDADDGTDTNTLLSAAFEIVEEKRGGHWEHRVFPTHRGRDLCCGIAWDAARVTPLGEPRIVTDPNIESVQDRTIWSRPPRGWLFSAGDGLTDFVVIVIHMKSNYGGDFSQHRGQEAQYLVADLPDAFDDPDVLIIGDANCSTHTEAAVSAIRAAGFVDLNAGDIETHWRYGPLDRAFVPTGQPEFARQCFDVLSDSFFAAHELTVTDFKVRYSDHFMVITEIDVGADDD